MSNLLPIVDLVKESLSYLGDDKDSLINSRKIQTMYFLQNLLKKTDEEVEDESKYKSLEKILISRITAYELLNKKAIELSGGDSLTGDGPDNSFLKKAKADVVEAEFEQLDIKKTASLAQTSEQIMANLKNEICAYAYQLGISIPIYCGCKEYDQFQPFVIIHC